MAHPPHIPPPTPPPPLPLSRQNGRSLPTLPPPAFSFKDATMDLILEDLSSRFILNLPDNELSSVERVCFQVEQAHWYYEDFIRQENPNLPSMPLRHFSAKLFAACPLLQGWSHRHEEAFADFVKYKTSVPVCGAILLNTTWDKCILVKGWKSSAPWGFPRGKINENEPLHNCAIREVLEETGFDCESRLLENIYITVHAKDQQLVTLFVVPNVPEDYQFLTRTRKEISKIDWFELSSLPGWSDDDNSHRGVITSSRNNIKTWNVSAFLTQLRNRLEEFQQAFGYVLPTKNRKRRNNPASHDAVRSTPARQRGSRRGQVDVDESEGLSDPPIPRNMAIHHESSSQSSVDPVTPSSSAIDAMFPPTSITNGMDDYPTARIANSTNSTPEKGTRRGKGRTKHNIRSVANSEHPGSLSVTSGPLASEGFPAKQDTASVHLNNLVQGLLNSSARLALSPSVGLGEAEVSSSGLPTPAESPQNATIPAAPKYPKDTRKPATNTVTRPESVHQSAEPALPSMFDFVSPFDALSASPPPSEVQVKRPVDVPQSQSPKPVPSQIPEHKVVVTKDRSLSNLPPTNSTKPRPVLPSRSVSDTTALERDYSRSVSMAAAATAAPALTSPRTSQEFVSPNERSASASQTDTTSASITPPSSVTTDKLDRQMAHLALLDMVASETSAIVQLPTPTEQAPPPVPPQSASDILYSSIPSMAPTLQPHHIHNASPALASPYLHNGLSPAFGIMNPASQHLNITNPQVNNLPHPHPHHPFNGPGSHIPPYYTPANLHGHSHPVNVVQPPEAWKHPSPPDSLPMQPRPSSGFFAPPLGPPHHSLLPHAPVISNNPAAQGLGPIPFGHPYAPPPVDRRMTGSLDIANPVFTHGGYHPNGNTFNQLRAPLSPGSPNPNSFNVQKPATNRNHLLEMFRAKSPSKPVVNPPSLSATVSNNGLSLTPLQQQLVGKISLRGQSPMNGRPSAASSVASSSPRVSSGLIPSTVQYRALAGAPHTPGFPGPSADRRSAVLP